jgi:hypothetical protein
MTAKEKNFSRDLLLRGTELYKIMFIAKGTDFRPSFLLKGSGMPDFLTNF